MRKQFLSYRSMVMPAQCDTMGHMNVQHYIAAFDLAMWQLVGEAGYLPPAASGRLDGWADVKHVLEYRKELKAGELFVIFSEVKRLGKTSMTSYHEVVTQSDHNIAASCEMTSVFFDLQARKSKDLPPELKNALTAFIAS